MPTRSTSRLAASITWTASKQTFYTIRYLVDMSRVSDAYKAYAYFRWVDDTLDQEYIPRSERIAFANRQRALIDCCYLDTPPNRLCPQEMMLVSLIQADREKNSGLESYLRNMMAVMCFDARRRGHPVPHDALENYENHLAVGVTEALHHFIGHGRRSPHTPERYLAAKGAHIAHMLRDTIEDYAAGYFNIPCEYLQFHQISPKAINSNPYKEWVSSRVNQAREYFAAGRAYLAQVKNWRCRLAGYMYIGRFEYVLDAIHRDDYCLRADYSERKHPAVWSKVLRSALWQAFNPHSQLTTEPVYSHPFKRMAQVKP